MTASPAAPDLATTPQDLEAIVVFLDRVGIAAELLDHPVEGFLDGVVVEHGRLRIGPNAQVEAVLHEAGHLATMPKPFRHLLGDNLARGQRQVFEWVRQADLDPECALVKHLLQVSDLEATAWAFAAGRALGFPDEKIIPDHGYGGEGASIRVCCQLGRYFGINGLAAAGMCDHGFAARMRGNPAYPAMLRWVQDGPYPEWEGFPLCSPAPSIRRQAMP